MDHFVKIFLFQLKKGKKKDHDPTILAVTNIHTQFYIQIHEYPSTRILAAALIVLKDSKFKQKAVFPQKLWLFYHK